MVQPVGRPLLLPQRLAIGAMLAPTCLFSQPRTGWTVASGVIGNGSYC